MKSPSQSAPSASRTTWPRRRTESGKPESAPRRRGAALAVHTCGPRHVKAAVRYEKRLAVRIVNAMRGKGESESGG